jgi:hypothetical protein
MSLFNINELGKSVNTSLTAQGLQISANSRYKLGTSLLALESTIGELAHDQCYQFSTAGKWSMHQLLEFVLLKTGPAKVWMTTWTITEEPMRALLDMLQRELITELNAIFDYRIERRKPEAFQLASKIITKIKLTKCHAKVLVIRNDQWNVTVIGSANFSKNPRIEAGCIFTDQKSADFNCSWIDDVIEGKEVFSAK